jgi:hypothetical protein
MYDTSARLAQALEAKPDMADKAEQTFSDERVQVVVEAWSQ